MAPLPWRCSASSTCGICWRCLCLEIWLDYRMTSSVLFADDHRLAAFAVSRILTLGSTISAPRGCTSTKRAGWLITVIAPSAFLLHGYVGFIFGSVKANPWWSSPLMPVVFLFPRWYRHRGCHAAVHASPTMRREPIDMCCVDTVAKYLSIPSLSISVWRCWI